MKTIAATLAFSALLLLPAGAASVARTYTYFSIGGTTLEEIESELDLRGPQLASTGTRHPGATRMEFTTRVTYGERGRSCGVIAATVSVKADMILPRWRKRNRADPDTRFIWDTISSDIKRHEESHVNIARNHAREMEAELLQLVSFRSCERARERVETVTAAILAKHDREQARFDRIESMSFEKRISGIMRTRLERMNSGN